MSCAIRRWGLALCAVALVVGDGRAATLDVVEDAADLIFTWDGGAAEDLLRGTSPDNLQPWMVAVSSPLRVSTENMLRGEDAYYRLASGSNMAYRIERTFDVPDPVRPISYAVTLPERHAFTTAFDLLQKWPTLIHAMWVDGSQGHWESATRGPAGLLIGDDELVPRHGGIWLEFSSTTTLTLVGSSDDSYAGVVADDFLWSPNVLAIPLDSRRVRLIDILCGDPGVDWFDVDGDGAPDECGTDTDGDTLPNTGFYAGTTLVVTGMTLPDDRIVVQRIIAPPGDRVLGNVGFQVERGEAVVLWTMETPVFNAPFRPPRW
jgi:hypothetical protein